jgi:hypothetical protein
LKLFIQSFFSIVFLVFSFLLHFIYVSGFFCCFVLFLFYHILGGRVIQSRVHCPQLMVRYFSNESNRVNKTISKLSSFLNNHCYIFYFTIESFHTEVNTKSRLSQRLASLTIRHLWKKGFLSFVYANNFLVQLNISMPITNLT